MSEHGELETPLGTMTCTLRAAKELTNYFGDFMQAFARLSAMDFGAYVAIAAAGLGKQRGDVEDAVFKAGMPALTEKLSEYVGLLANGGRKAEVDDKGKPKTGEA